MKAYLSRETGREKIETVNKVDKNILGGIIVKYGDKVFDGSLRKKLEEFRGAITK